MSRPHKVVVTDFITDALAPERSVLGDIADVVALNATDEKELVGKVEDAAALMVYHAIFRLSGATIDRLSGCKVITRCGVGYDNVELAAAQRRGIPVCNVPDYGTEEVADSAIGMMLTLTRGIHVLNSRLRDSREAWHYTHAAPLVRLRGRTLGIIGLGRIGSTVAVRGKAIGMRVLLYYDPYTPDGYDKALGVTRAETLDELLAQSDVVTCHCPLTTETRHMVNAAAIAKLKRGSSLVNNARGSVVDSTAIPDAIASGQLAGAGIDVLETESPLPDHPADRRLARLRSPGPSPRHRQLRVPLRRGPHGDAY